VLPRVGLLALGPEVCDRRADIQGMNDTLVIHLVTSNHRILILAGIVCSLRISDEALNSSTTDSKSRILTAVRAL
jgi:hypothetical protein